MKKLLWTGLLVTLLLPISARAQSVFDGTWKTEIDSAKMADKPEVFLLQNGTYQCTSCVPPINVKADGQDQKIAGDPYRDSTSVKVLDDRTVEIADKKDGKVVATAKTTVSADGNSLTVEFTNSSGTASFSGKGEATRVAKGPAGSHAMSGSWKFAKLESMSESALLVTYKVEGDTLTMTTPTGQSYTAKLDGTDAPYKGDPGTTSVSVKLVGKNTLEETDKRDGKVMGIARVTVSADGKTATVEYIDKVQGTTSQFVAKKQ